MPYSRVQSLDVGEGEKRGLISRTAAGNRSCCLFCYTKILLDILISSVTCEIII